MELWPTVVEITLVVDDNVMKNVLLLTARVTSIWSRVNPIAYLVKIMVGLHIFAFYYSIV